MGATSLVKRTVIKSGAIEVGKKAFVVWGKSKKTHNAEVVDNDSRVAVQQPVEVQQPATSNEDEPLVMKLVDPAPTENRPTHEERQPTLIIKMECLTDLISGLEARIHC